MPSQGREMNEGSVVKKGKTLKQKHEVTNVSEKRSLLFSTGVFYVVLVSLATAQHWR